MQALSYGPLFPSRQKQRVCTMGSIARPSRPRLWMALLLFLLSIAYSVEIKRNVRIVYEYAVLKTYTIAAKDAPPNYAALREWERRLPQHNPDLPFPEGRSGRYVLFANSRAHQAGWNNKLNDMLRIFDHILTALI